MKQIYMEGKQLDVSQDFSEQITYAIDDLNNLDSKSTAFSKTIILPATAKNNNYLGNIFDFNNANFTIDNQPNILYNFNASKSAKASISENGLQIIKGVLRLLEIVYEASRVVEYEVAIIGELGGFVAKLGNSRLEDLDFSAYDHTLSYANITDSWDNANSGVGYYYPLVDIGGVSTGAFGTIKKDYQYRALRPAYHVREYMDKIITSAGYTFESTFFDTDLFKRLIIPYSAKSLTRVSSTGLHVRYTGFGQSLVSPDTSFLLELPIQYTLGGFTTSDNKTYTYTGSEVNGTFYANVEGTINYLQNNPTAFNCGIQLIINQGGVFYSDIYYFSDTGFSTIPFNIALQVNGKFNTGDYVVIVPFGDPFGDTPDEYTITVTAAILQYTLSTLSPVQVNINEDIAGNDIMPKGIFQKDFFASILKMFYLMVTEDKFKEKHLVIEPWINFFDTGNFENWTDKVDRSKQIRIKPMSEINARFYELKFKSDNDFYNDDYRKKYNEGYGDRIYNNGLEFARDKDTTEVIFAATPLLGYIGEDKIVPTTFKKANSVEDTQDCVIRIMQAKKVTGVTSWQIMNGATNLGSNTDYGYAGHLDDPDAPDADINFGVPKEIYFALVSGDLSNNLFNAYYSSYIAEITDKDSRLLSCMLKLSDMDIFNLDFSRLKYIDGGLWRLSKLIDYTIGANDTTKAELLRVIQIQY